MGGKTARRATAENNRTEEKSGVKAETQGCEELPEEKERSEVNSQVQSERQTAPRKTARRATDRRKTNTVLDASNQRGRTEAETHPQRTTEKKKNLE